MYINIDLKEFNKQLDSAKSTALAEMGNEEGKDSALWMDIQEVVDEAEINNGNLDIHIDSKLGFFSFSIPIDDYLLEIFIKEITRRLNKLKTLIESVK